MKKKLSLLFLTFIFTMLFSATAMAAPDKVVNIRQTEAYQRYATIEWDAAANSQVGAYYNIQVSSDQVNWKDATSYSSSLKYTLYSLNPGLTYYVRVRCWDTTGTGEFSDVFEVVTAPEHVTNLKQTKATESTITLSWTKSAGATGYQVCKWVNDKEVVLGTTSKTTFTVKNLNNKKEITYPIYVKARKKGANFTAVHYSKYYSSYAFISHYNLVLQPKKPAKPVVSTYYHNTDEIYIRSVSIPYGEEYQYEAYNSNGKKIFSDTTTYSVYIKKITAKQFYKIRVRAKTYVNGKALYSKWSDYNYVSNCIKLSLKRSGSNIKINWEKCKGATSYTVYASTVIDMKYKKVATLGKNSSSYTLKKFNGKSLSKNKTYYIYVVANKKVGNTTYKSGATYAYYLY